MCGRFASARSELDVATLYRFSEIVDPPLPPSWNIAPTQDARVIAERYENGEPVRQLRTMRWGLVPHWAKDVRIGSRMINARVETLAEKPAFRKAFAKRRLIVPMDGYYEWEAIPGKRKQPYYLTDPGGKSLAVAGLFEIWRNRVAEDEDPADDTSDNLLRTFTIITTSASDTLGHIHDRSPLILPSDYWDAWLDPDFADVAELAALTMSLGQPALQPIKVSPAVGNVKNNGPELIKPVEPVELVTADVLF